ncbi:MAG TPA: hypothetical protein VF339_06220 [Gammaproteobacteria bacterium]
MIDRDELLEHYRQRYEDEADGVALLEALHRCLRDDAPKWLQIAVGRALVRYDGAESRTLDEAFGVRRPKHWTRKRARKDAFDLAVYLRVIEHRRRTGEAIGRVLFENVADELSRDGPFEGVHFNGTDVQDAYYRVARLAGISKNSR